MPLAKDTNEKIFTTISSTEQVELCDYVVINGERFDRESKVLQDYRIRQDSNQGITGHVKNCICFICNH